MSNVKAANLPRPNASALTTPLALIVKMGLLEEKTYRDLQKGKRPPSTLGDIFHQVTKDDWAEKAGESFGMSETRAYQVKDNLAKAAQNLSLMIK